MNLSSQSQTFYFLAINLIYALLALVVTAILIIFIDKILFRKIDFIEEIKKGNMAAAVFYSTTLLFAAIVVSNTIS